MKHTGLIVNIILGFLLLGGSRAQAADQELPVMDGKKVVATVNEEPIYLEELNRAILSTHASRPKVEKAGRVDYSGIMKRLINIRLILLEAKNMGFDELPEITGAVDKYSRETLMELLLEGQVKDVGVDEEAVEKRYRAAVREWLIRSVSFKNEENARWFESQLKGGEDFDRIVKKAVADGLAEADERAEYVKDRDLRRPLDELVADMTVGAVSPVVKIDTKKFVVFKIEDVRIPEVEDPEARWNARRETLDQNRIAAARNYYDDLKRKYAKVDQTLVDKLDYESKAPGLEKLLQDQRVIAKISGEPPITVADLTEALKQKFFHGFDLAVAGKRVNKAKNPVLQDMLQRRVLLKEARNRDIDETEEYLQRVKDYRDSVIFGAFVNKVVAPEIKLDLKELEADYQADLAKYSSPQMVRIKSLVFHQRPAAVQAIDQLQRGADFDWLSAHAQGQVDLDVPGILKFADRPITIDSLPADVQKATAGVKSGDFRLYAAPGGPFYVLYIQQTVAPRTKPFEEVKDEVAKKVYNDKLKKSVEFWADQIGKYYPVKIYRADLAK